MQKLPLLWLDLEMTGLDAEKDVILEIAVTATDFNLETMVEGPDLVIHQSEENLKNMGKWVSDMHAKSGLIERVAASRVTVQEAEKAVLAFVHEMCDKDFYFAGNTIYQDRNFLKKYMPTLNSKAHYRMIDVSTLKVLIQAWYPHAPERMFKKSKTHRALDDVRESIAELGHFRKYFFKN